MKFPELAEEDKKKVLKRRQKSPAEITALSSFFKTRNILLPPQEELIAIMPELEPIHKCFLVCVISKSIESLNNVRFEIQLTGGYFSTNYAASHKRGALRNCFHLFSSSERLPRLPCIRR